MTVGPSLLFPMLALVLAVMVGVTLAVLKVYPGEASGMRGGLRTLSRLAGAFLVVWGVHLYWNFQYGTNIPWWDQWGAEFARLYGPWIEGRLTLGDLLAPHNEHRIFTHRIWALGLLALNGQWDGTFMVMMSTAIHAGSMALLAEVLYRLFRGVTGAFLFLGAVVLPCLPMGWPNDTQGFQSQFYFLQFFGNAAMLLLLGGRPGTRAWALGWLCLPLAYLSLSGGALVAAALAVGFLLRSLLRDWTWKAGGLSAGFAAILFGLGYALVPEVPGHQGMKPDDLGRFLEAVGRYLAWPFVDRTRPLSEFLWAPPLLWAIPVGAFALVAWQRLSGRDRLSDADRRGLALAGGFTIWAFMTIGAVAYSRGGLEAYGFSWRYNDLTLYALLGALLAGACVWRGALVGPRVMPGRAVILLSLGVWGLGLFQHNEEALRIWLPRFDQFGEEQVRRVSEYMTTGNFELLSEAEHLRIPHPSAAFLRDRLEDPVLQGILPWTIRRPLALERLARVGPVVFETGGIPVQVEDRPGEVLRGNFGPASGSFRRGEDRFRTRAEPSLPFLVIYLSGDPKSEGIGLRVEREGGGGEKIWRSGPGTRWLERRFWVGKAPFELVAGNTLAGKWFGFNEPREMGLFSFSAIWLTKRYAGFIWIGGALLFFAMMDAYSWRIFQERSEKS